MTENRHFKATARNRAGYLGHTYRRAQRDIAVQLESIAEFRYLPVMWGVASDTGLDQYPPVDKHRAALGAIELAIRDTQILAGATMRDCWRTIDGHIDLDWEGGPYCHEIVRALISNAEDADTPGLEPGELVPGIDRVGDLNSVWIYGVRVRFRPYRPIGAEASKRLAWERVGIRLAADNAGTHHG